jgi:hypothetical protein
MTYWIEVFVVSGLNIIRFTIIKIIDKKLLSIFSDFFLF